MLYPSQTRNDPLNWVLMSSKNLKDISELYLYLISHSSQQCNSMQPLLLHHFRDSFTEWNKCRPLQYILTKIAYPNLQKLESKFTNYRFEPHQPRSICSSTFLEWEFYRIILLFPSYLCWLNKRIWLQARLHIWFLTSCLQVLLKSSLRVRNSFC